MDNAKPPVLLYPDRRALIQIAIDPEVGDTLEAELFAGDVLREISHTFDRRGWAVYVRALEEGAAAGVRRAELEVRMNRR